MKDLPVGVPIGVAASMLRVSNSCVRHWEAQGKLSSLRTTGGWRLFPIDEVKRLQRRLERKP